MHLLFLLEEKNGLCEQGEGFPRHGLLQEHGQGFSVQPARKMKGEKMRETKAIKNISKQISAICFSIISYIEGMEECKDSMPNMYEHFENMVMDEVSHMQLLTLGLTELVADDADSYNEKADESAFMQGELNSVIPEKKEEKPQEPAPQEQEEKPDRKLRW